MCLDAHICTSVCFSENVNCGTSKERVQGRTSESVSLAHESDDTHYLLRDLPETTGSKKQKKAKSKDKKQSSRMTASVQALSVGDALKMIEENFDGRRGKFKRMGKKRHSRKAGHVKALSVDDALRILERNFNRPRQRASRRDSLQHQREEAHVWRVTRGEQAAGGMT